MIIGAAEALCLAGLVVLLYWLLRPLRRSLEARIARRLLRKPAGTGARVIVLERRKDGTFGREDNHGR